MPIGRLLFRLACAAGGFHYLRVKGKPASKMEAPIIVAAPHAGLFDILIAVILWPPPTIISREENAKLPILGSTFSHSYMYQ